MHFKPVNFNEKFSKFDELWSPKVIAEMNDIQFKTVQVQGDFVWHKQVNRRQKMMYGSKWVFHDIYAFVT